MNNKTRLSLSLILGLFLASGPALAGNMMKGVPGIETKTETKMMDEEQTMEKDTGMMDESKMENEKPMEDSSPMGMEPDDKDSMRGGKKMDTMQKM